MEIQEAFDNITAKLKSASTRGIAPSIRISGDDWVCTIDERKTKSVIIAKKEELVLVDMELHANEPKIQRIAVPEDDREKVINRIKKVVTEVYGTLPAA
jgi:hypothetical protein